MKYDPQRLWSRTGQPPARLTAEPIAWLFDCPPEAILILTGTGRLPLRSRRSATCVGCLTAAEFPQWCQDYGWHAQVTSRPHWSRRMRKVASLAQHRLNEAAKLEDFDDAQAWVSEFPGPIPTRPATIRPLDQDPSSATPQEI